MGEENKNTTAGVVVPQHQLDEWDEEAEELDYNRSQYVRHHVESGRKQLADLHPSNLSGENSLEEEILSALDQDEPLPPEEVIERILEPIREQAYETIELLDDKGEIKFQVKDGGYVKNE